jgi:MFS transporter, OFA family, oxalate/formate antiporter
MSGPGCSPWIALGAVYAWSVFRTPLVRQFGWTISEVTMTFTISIFMLGVASFFGGLWLTRRAPRVVALTGGLFYGVGVFLASLSSIGLWWLYLTYGMIGGIGLGLAYIGRGGARQVVPRSPRVDHRHRGRRIRGGRAGDGAGGDSADPERRRPSDFCLYLGLAFLIVTVAGSFFMINPPDGWRPVGWAPTASVTAQRSTRDYTLREALGTWQWWALWLILFLNTSAGISVLSQEAPLFKELTAMGAVAAAGLVGITSIGIAFGRVLWAWASDSITRKAAFISIFVLQVLLFWILPSIRSASLLTVLAFIILMCYGGGFGTMPTLTAGYFGSKNVGPIYGLMLTAWGFASAFGPLMIAHMRQASGSYRGALHVIAGVMLVSILLPLIVSPPSGAASEPIPAPGRKDQKTA